MAIRAFLRRGGHTCYGINLTRHRRPDEDGLFFPDSAIGVITLIWKLRADIIHLHIGGDLTTRLLALGAISSAMPGSKSVLTFHSGGFPSSDAARLFLASRSKRRLLQRFHHLIAVNEQIRQFFVRAGIPPSRIRVISPYATVQPHCGPLPPRLEEFLASHQPLLMTIGLLEPEYDLPLQVELLGELLSSHANAGLLIVGSGSLHHALSRFIDSKPWRDRIFLYGDLEHSMTLAALQRAHVFLRTTLYDGDALSVREALELGVPVVATRTVFRPEGVTLVPIGDRNAIRQAVADSLNSGAKPAAPPGGDRNIAAVITLYEEALPPR